MTQYDYGRKLLRNQSLKEYCKDNPDSSYAEIGKIFGVSRQRVHQIVTNYHMRNREALNEQRRRSWRGRTEEQRKQIREQQKIAGRKHNWNLRLRLIAFMGGKCQNCDIEDPRVLQINHINGGGVKEFREKGCQQLYKDILSGKRKTNDIELLCANCNVIYEYEQGRRYCG